MDVAGTCAGATTLTFSGAANTASAALCCPKGHSCFPTGDTTLRGLATLLPMRKPSMNLAPQRLSMLALHRNIAAKATVLLPIGTMDSAMAPLIPWLAITHSLSFGTNNAIVALLHIVAQPLARARETE